MEAPELWQWSGRISSRGLESELTISRPGKDPWLVIYPPDVGDRLVTVRPTPREEIAIYRDGRIVRFTTQPV